MLLVMLPYIKKNADKFLIRQQQANIPNLQTIRGNQNSCQKINIIPTKLNSLNQNNLINYAYNTKIQNKNTQSYDDLKLNKIESNQIIIKTNNNNEFQMKNIKEVYKQKLERNNRYINLIAIFH